ncbi:MAG: hypothetical protein KBF88_11165, partial [Polyangiaceae bacterium]|nr:hypothetical protein [Polyangiaceae bacterium]
MKNLLTTFAVGSTVSILFSCATLPDLRNSICGDGILQKDEDCDPLATSLQLASWKAGENATCGAQGQPLACRYVAAERLGCPVGWGRSTAGVCVKPSSKFSPHSVPVESSARSFRGGDFDGDGVADLAFISAGRMHVIYGDTSTPFETGRALSKAIQSGQVATDRLQLALEPALAAGDVSADGADDLVLVSPGIGGRDNDRLSVNIGAEDSFLTSVIPTYRIEELVGRPKEEEEDKKLPRRRQKLLRLRGTFLNASSKTMEEGTGVFVFAPSLATPLLRTNLVQFGLEPTLPPLEIPYTVAIGVQSMSLTPLSTCDVGFVPSKDANSMFVLPLPSCADSPTQVKEFKLTGVSNVEAYTVYDYDRDGRNDLVIKGSQAGVPAVLSLRGQGTADTLSFAPPARADRFYEGTTPRMPFAILEDGPSGLLFLEKEGNVNIWSRDNGGTFKLLHEMDRGNASQIKVGDFDGEGPLDAWVVQGTNAGFIKARSITDVKFVSYALSDVAVQIDTGDLDGDG